MPVMNGLEACRQISGNRTRLLPIVVFVTAHAMDTFRQDAQKAGGYGFISKPFNIDKIDELIKSIPWENLTEAEHLALPEGRPEVGALYVETDIAG